MLQTFMMHKGAHYLILDVPNIHGAQGGTSYFNYINIYGITPSFDGINMDLGWRRDNLSWQDLSYYCKNGFVSGNTII